MKLTRQEEIGLLLVGSLAESVDQYMPLSTIARNHRISRLFLKKIARQLKMKELLISKEGVDGGYRLGRDPSDIRVVDVLSAVSTSLKNQTQTTRSSTRRCPLQPACLPSQINVLINETLQEYLSDITITQLLYHKKTV